ncbi:hypothetical protein Trydic_g2201 [Trypoxylus dichotomus]
MVGGPPTCPMHYINLRKKEKQHIKPIISLSIRPRSLLCASYSEDTINPRSYHNHSNTWKFHRPRPKSISRKQAFVSRRDLLHDSPSMLAQGVADNVLSAIRWSNEEQILLQLDALQFFGLGTTLLRYQPIVQVLWQ